jgi:hypothetical protein
LKPDFHVTGSRVKTRRFLQALRVTTESQLVQPRLLVAVLGGSGSGGGGGGGGGGRGFLASLDFHRPTGVLALFTRLGWKLAVENDDGKKKKMWWWRKGDGGRRVRRRVGEMWSGTAVCERRKRHDTLLSRRSVVEWGGKNKNKEFRYAKKEEKLSKNF